MHRGREYHPKTEEQDEHDDPPLTASTSNTRRSVPVPNYRDRHLEVEPIDSKLPEPTKDNKSPGGDREQHGDAKISEPSSQDLPDFGDFRPDTSSEGSNPADHEPIPNVRNEYYPKYFIDEFEDLEDTMKVYVKYRIAGGRMTFKESDTGNEYYYAQFPGR